MARVTNSISQPILDIPSVCIPINHKYVDMLQNSLTSMHSSFRFLQLHLQLKLITIHLVAFT
jgi:hypothetical protein